MDRPSPRTLIGLILTAFFAVGCAASQRSLAPSSEATTFGSCDPVPCAKVATQDLPRLSESIPEEVRELIYSQVDAILYAPLDESAGAPSRGTFLQSVQSQFAEYLDLRSSDAPSEWEVTRTASLLTADDGVVSVKLSSEGFVGGAHGFHDERLISFDTTTGKALSWDDLVGQGSRVPLLRVAEAEFRKVKNVPLSESLREAGFEFPDGSEFALPSNFAVTREGLRLHYNPYEIAPYVMGPTDLVIPPGVASGVLRSDLPALAVLRDSDTLS